MNSSDRIAFFTAAFVGLSALAAIIIPIWQHQTAKRAMAEQVSLSRQSAELAERSAGAAEQSSWTAKQGMIIGQRCWLNIQAVKVTQWVKTNQLPSDVSIEFHNGGPTPAEEVSAEVYLRFDDEFRPLYDGENVAKGRFGPIGPGAIEHMYLSLKEDNDRHLVFLEGLTELYLFGQIRYEDVFGDRHSTTFGYYFNRAAQRFHATEVHNHMTDYARIQEDDGEQ